MRTFVPRLIKELKEYISTLHVDMAYAKFFFRCLLLQKQVMDTYQIWLTPRTIDNLLVDAANKGLANRYLLTAQGDM